MPTNRKTMKTISMHSQRVSTTVVISSGPFVSKYQVILIIYSPMIEERLISSSFLTKLTDDKCLTDIIINVYICMCRYITYRWAQVLEAMIVAAISGVVAFCLSYFSSDCQAIGKDPNNNTLQVHNIPYICPVLRRKLFILWLCGGEDRILSQVKI